MWLHVEDVGNRQGRSIYPQMRASSGGVKLVSSPRGYALFGMSSIFESIGIMAEVVVIVVLRDYGWVVGGVNMVVIR